MLFIFDGACFVVCCVNNVLLCLVKTVCALQTILQCVLSLKLLTHVDVDYDAVGAAFRHCVYMYGANQHLVKAQVLIMLHPICVSRVCYLCVLSLLCVLFVSDVLSNPRSVLDAQQDICVATELNGTGAYCYLQIKALQGTHVHACFMVARW